jgi:hypothetical protein
MKSSDEALIQQLNMETGQIAWPELQRHFARGVVIKVEPELDLIDVAVKFVKDDRTAIESWLNGGSIARASDEDATTWAEATTVFWAIVVAPWVLIQELKE